MGLDGLGEWIKDTVNQFADYIKPWTLVNQYEEAIILRFGKYHRTLKPGLHPKWPLAEYHISAQVKEETIEGKAINITTADGKTISMSGIVTYDVEDIRKFLLDNNDSVSNLGHIIRAKMSEHLEDVRWEDIKKKTTRNAVRRLLTTEALDLGVKVKDFDFGDKCEIRAYKFFTDGEKSNLML